MKEKFTEEQKEEIRKKRAEGAKIMSLAVEYDTSISTIARIINPEYAESIRKHQNARYHRQKEELRKMREELEAVRGNEEKRE